MDELKKTIKEFLDSGEDNISKNRYNVAVSDFFKAIVISCDYLIYKDMKITSKNHSQRFSILEQYYKDIYTKVSFLFKKYTESYASTLKKEDAENVKNYAYELRRIIEDKK